MGPEISEFAETVVDINRVSKKTKGGNQIRFSALIVVGDRKGQVGAGIGKATNVVGAIRKASAYAKKHMVNVPLKDGTVPFAVKTKFSAAHILVKPAPSGSGIVAGGALRAVFEACGVRDIVAKILGSNNKTTNVYAAIKALDQINKLYTKHAK